MLGHVYVVEDARDLAQIVRDVTRYGGAYRPEVRPRLESAVSSANPSLPLPSSYLFLKSGCIRIHSTPLRLEED